MPERFVFFFCSELDMYRVEKNAETRVPKFENRASKKLLTSWNESTETPK